MQRRLLKFCGKYEKIGENKLQTEQAADRMGSRLARGTEKW